MTIDYERPGWGLDQRQALMTAASRLQRDFAGVFGVETIDRFLHGSLRRVCRKASITAHLPLLAERFARQRLRAMARVEGKALQGVPTVLFVCVHNAGRSQIPVRPQLTEPA
jgi:hypothetical protein